MNMTVGQTLKAAREQKHLTLSEVAAALNTSVHVVESMEKDNFRTFAAPVYARGFIKLYTRCVGIDPQPLLQDYMNSLTSIQETVPTVDRVAKKLAREPPASADAQSAGLTHRMAQRIAQVKLPSFNLPRVSLPDIRLSFMVWKTILLAVLTVFVLFMALWGLYSWMDKEKTTPSAGFRFLKEPPSPYLDTGSN